MFNIKIYLLGIIWFSFFIYLSKKNYSLAMFFRVLMLKLNNNIAYGKNKNYIRKI